MYHAVASCHWGPGEGGRGGAPQIFYNVLLLFTFYNLKNIKNLASAISLSSFILTPYPAFL